MNLLGIFHSGSDPSASLLVDGDIVAFAEEERFSRSKHAVGAFPTSAIRYCLDRAGFTLSNIDAVVFPWDASRFDDGTIRRHLERFNRDHRIDEGSLAWQGRFLEEFTSARQRNLIQRHLRQAFGGEVPEVVFVPHHFAHASGAYFLSPFPEAIVFCIDGSGDQHCTTVWHGKGDELSLLASIDIPHSLGWFYAGMTEYLGFRAYDGEYKVMGLAAYGTADDELLSVLRALVTRSEGSYSVDPEIFYTGARHYSLRYSDALVEKLGRSPRRPHDPIEPWHKNLAWATQRILEETIEDLVRHYICTTGVPTICLTGGVAQNVKLNGRLSCLPEVEDIFILPLCADAGTSLCGALAYHMQHGGARPAPLKDIYLGPEYSNDAIAKTLDQCGIAHEEHEDVGVEAARALADGQVLAWFQGRMEGGPRALGNRSILADPRDVAARDRLNAAVKYREFWRPFCPSLTLESSATYCASRHESPFMTNACPATPAARERVPAAVHIDGTMRPQTVRAEVNPPFHRLLQSFHDITGESIVINTSFNVKGEPLVCSPTDAVRCFFGSGLDVLVIGAFVVRKPHA